MSLNSQPVSPVPPETTRMAKAVFAQGNPYLTLRDKLGCIFEDADFEQLFSQTGQPAVPPWQLALVTVLQFRENLSDRQAAEAVRSRINWKYLLGLELTDPGFDFSVLSEFRHRLIQGEVETLLLEKLLQRCQALGIVKARSKQRTDSTRVLAAIRKLNRLELVGETLRAALNELATIAPEWVRQTAPDDWYERYGRRVEDYRLPKSADQREAYAQQVGNDGDYLLACLAQPEVPPEWQTLASVKALKLAWQRHYERTSEDPPDGSRLRWKSKQELAKADAAMESPYDVEARYRLRSGVSWVGYIVHLSETCEEDACHLITHAMTTDATVHEVQCTEDLHQALIAKALPPAEHFVDSAYVDAQLLVASQKQGIEMVGPTRPDPSWQAKTEGAFDLSQFDIDWQNQQLTCPQGKRSHPWREYIRASGQPCLKVKFRVQDCAECPVRSRCTRAKSRVARSVWLMPQAEYEALKQAREHHASPEGRERYQRRAGVEGTISQGVRGFGLRRSRYRGLAKTHLQNIAIGAAINIDRLVNWFNDVPLAKTRVSRFKKLKPA